MGVAICENRTCSRLSDRCPLLHRTPHELYDQWIRGDKSAAPLPASSPSSQLPPQLHLDDLGQLKLVDAEVRGFHFTAATNAKVSDGVGSLPLRVPDDFLCPISGQIMSDPVITTCGHSYDRTSIERWFQERGAAQCSYTDPKTNMALDAPLLIPNHTLRSVIQHFVASVSTTVVRLPPKQTVDEGAPVKSLESIV